MIKHPLPWQEQLAIIDDTMKAISGISDPEELVAVYWEGIGKLITIEDYVALSRRDVEPPFYFITRSSRFTEHPNPWTQRELLPKLSGGILGQLAYANQPVIITDLATRLTKDDPAYFYLQGFAQLVAYPQYDNGQGLNVTVMLLPPGIELDPAIIPMLHWQSGLFGRGTQNLILRNQLSGALTALDAELKVVGEIQRSLLPKTLPTIPGFELAAFYQTSAQAGGDYYDFFPLADGSWGLFIADVSGHGTPAAVLMAITHAIAHSHPGTHTPPASLLHYLNEQLINAYIQPGTFITAFYAVLNPATRTLTYARAGHNPPRLVHNNQILALDGAGALPLGILPHQPFDQATIQLAPTDLLLLYTDGITEAMSPPINDRQLFGTDRLDALLLASPHATAAQILDCIRAEVTTFTAHAPLIDDQTLIALRAM